MAIGRIFNLEIVIIQSRVILKVASAPGKVILSDRIPWSHSHSSNLLSMTAILLYFFSYAGVYCLSMVAKAQRVDPTTKEIRSVERSQFWITHS